MKNNVPYVVESTLENIQAGISSDCSNCLKGFFAICVLIHHLYQHSGLLHQTIIGGVYKQLDTYRFPVSFSFQVMVYMPLI